VAKPGGKSGGERKGKRSEREKDKTRAKPGKAPKPGAPGKSAKRSADGGKAKSKPASAKSVKSGKAKWPRGAQRLVEQVAQEIVVAEYDRAVNGTSAADAPPVPRVAVQEPPRPNAEELPEPADDDNDDADGTFSDLLRLPAGPVDLAAIDTAATPGASSREQAEAKLPKLAARLDELQERLFAASRGGGSKRRVLLVLQGMDTSGKGGTVRHVVGQLDPNGIRVAAFKAPTEEERAHDFLWRIRNVLPTAGEVGIFDRSHYEDVLVARVHKLALPMVIGKRYQLINRFEQGLADDGVVLVKCFLHISPEEQKKRLLTRLDDPSKHWKYNPTDVDERALWPEYQEAYRLVLERCSTEFAPWYVLPADRKWYRNYVITRLLLEALERIDPVYPRGTFDVEVERKRLLAG
jgi:PPK2 family polyphosphate:nucleotide phosphotransferase